MHLAVTGKGGSGKTVLTTLLARAFLERGERVLAIDLDVNPGLALSLGLPADDVTLPDEMIEAREGAPYGFGLAAGVDPDVAVDRYARRSPAGIYELGVGNIDRPDHVVARSITAVREVYAGFRRPGWTVIADIEAGPATPFEGFCRPADLVLVCTDATPAARLAAERVLSILDHDGVPSALVVTRSTGAGDHRTVTEHFRGREVIGEVPFDPVVLDHERRGGAIDAPATSAAVRAVAGLVAGLTAGQEVVAS